jgi:hypothetical protein
MTTQIRHTDDGEMLHRLRSNGWDLIKTNFHDRCSRGMGGWWLYRGDHGEALALLAPIQREITQRVRELLA